LNVASSGRFSSDRSIAEYASEIWKVEPCPGTLETQSLTGEPNISLLAGKPAPKELLVDVARLEKEYFERRPDLDDPNQLVSFGTSGHRGSPPCGSFNEAHILAITQAICEYRHEQIQGNDHRSQADGNLLLSWTDCSSSLRSRHRRERPATLTKTPIWKRGPRANATAEESEKLTDFYSSALGGSSRIAKKLLRHGLTKSLIPNVFSKDRDFQDYLKSSEAAAAARIRRVPQPARARKASA
jgi:hypothetical protein